MDADIFISYSHTDKEYAVKLVTALSEQGFLVWLDEAIEYGQRWFTAISQAIRNCSAVIVIMTPEAEASEWVEREIFIAQKYQKPIFPLLFRGEGFDLLITSQYVDVRDGNVPPQDFYRKLNKVKTTAPTINRSSSLKASKTLTSLLENALTEIETITATDYNQIFLLAKLNFNPELVAVADAVPEQYRYRVASLGGLLGIAVTSSQTLNEANVFTNKKYVAAVAETRSEIVVPIIRLDTVVGVINSESETQGYYSDRMQSTLEQLAAELAEGLFRLGWTPDAPKAEIPWIKKRPKKIN